MKTEFNKNKIIAGTATALLFASMAGMIYMNHNNDELSGQLDDSKLKSEHLYSEKLSLDKEIVGYKNQLASLRGKNADLDKKLIAMNDKLDKAGKELKNIQWDKAKSKQLEGKLAEIGKIRADLEKQVVSMNSIIVGLRSNNEELQNTLAALQKDNQDLTANYEVLQALVATNYRVEATRGNHDKLTASARKTKKLTMSFDLPQNVVENVKFNIVTPEGRTVTTANGEVIHQVIEDGSDLTASISSVGDEFEITKRIEMSYKPEKKMKSGIYQISIYNNDKLIGSCQVKLK